MSTAKQIHVGLRQESLQGPAHVEITIPAGTRRADLAELLQRVAPGIDKLRPRGCATCLSGADIRIRERFEEILTLDI